MSYTLTAIEPGRNSGNRSFHVSGELCVFNIGQIKSDLLALLDSTTPMEINLAQVSEIDTAGIQLLLIVLREAARLQCPLHFTEASDPVRNNLSLLNLLNEIDATQAKQRRSKEKHR